jgi:hypothetical protein
MNTQLTKAAYQIRVQGQIDPRRTGWPGLAITNQENNSHTETLLLGRDLAQAALRGLLIRLWDLNLTLVSVNRIEASAGGTS